MGKKNKERSRVKKRYKTLSFLFTITSIMLFAMVLFVNILPFKYLLIFSLVLLMLNLLIRYFLCKKKSRKKTRKFFSLVAFVLSIIFLLVTFLIFKTFGVLSGMTQDFKEYTYYVIVREESPYQKLEDINNKSLGYYNDNTTFTKKALATLKEKVSIKEDGYGNLDSLGGNLLSADIDAIILEESEKIKVENAGKSGNSASVKGFADKTRTIYTYKVKLKNESSDINVTKDVFNVYISGMDEYGEVIDASRSDVNIVATINPKTKQLLLTNIPRDYYVQIHDTTGLKDKLTHAGIYGIDTSAATVEDLLGIKIDYYVKVNFSSLVNIVNALGGVEVYSEYDFQSWNGYNYSKGYNRVNGEEALSFVRERKSFNDGDNQRGKNQQALIEAIFRKCTSPSIITKYNGLLNSLDDSMITNMPMKSITKLAKMQLKEGSKWIITSNNLTGEGGSYYTYTYPYQALYVTIPDENSLSLAKSMIEKVSNDEVLAASYDEDSSDVHTVTKSIVSKIFGTSKSNNNNNSSNSEKPKTEEKKEAIVINPETQKKEEVASENETTTESEDTETETETNNNANENTNNDNNQDGEVLDNSTNQEETSSKDQSLDEQEENTNNDNP